MWIKIQSRLINLNNIVHISRYSRTIGDLELFIIVFHTIKNEDNKLIKDIQFNFDNEIKLNKIFNEINSFVKENNIYLDLD